MTMGGEGLEKLPQIEIVPATPEDAAAIQQLMYASVRATYPNEETGITMDDVMDRYKDEFSPKGLDELAKSLAEPEAGVKNFVAKDNGKVVGYCRARENEQENLLSRIHVLPERKGERIGTLLWKQAQTAFNPAKDTALWVVEDNTNAIRAYEKWGFAMTEAGKETRKEEGMQSTAVRKEMKMILKAPEPNPERPESTGDSPETPEPYLIVEVGSGDEPFLVGTPEEYREQFRQDPSVQYIGVDLDETELRYGRDLVARKDEKINLDLGKTGRVHYVKAKGEQLPFADGTISELVLKNVLGDDEIKTHKKAGMLRETARALKTGGILKIVEQYTPRVIRVEDVEKYLNTALPGVFERVAESDSGKFDEAEMDRRMLEKKSYVSSSAYILRFQKVGDLDKVGV